MHCIASQSTIHSTERASMLQGRAGSPARPRQALLDNCCAVFRLRAETLADIRPGGILGGSVESHMKDGCVCAGLSKTILTPKAGARSARYGG